MSLLEAHTTVLDTPETQEAKSTVDEPYVTILVGQNGSRRQIDLTFRQYMQLPELHEGGEATDTLRTLEQKLQIMGVLETQTIDPKRRAPGQHERVISDTPQDPEQIAKAEALLAKFASRGNGNGNGKKKKRK